MNIDLLLARGLYGSDWLAAVRAHEAEFTVDGIRLGGIDFETETPSIHDPRLSKPRAEIESAAYLLARLGYRRVALFSKSATGKLESPDLEADLPEGRIGLEVAEAIDQSVRARDAEVQRLQIDLRDLCDNDSTFSVALGASYLTINLSAGISDAGLGKRDRLALMFELERFIRNRDHLQIEEDDFAAFPTRYEELWRRGARYSTTPSAHQYITVTAGAHTVDVDHSADIVRRVLDDHRTAATRYRPIPAWMIIFLTDPLEFARDTIPEIRVLNPPIDPFDRCYISDVVGRVVLLRKDGAPVDLTGDLPPRAPLAD